MNEILYGYALGPPLLDTPAAFLNRITSLSFSLIHSPNPIRDETHNKPGEETYEAISKS